MSLRESSWLTAEALAHPVLERIDAMARDAVGIGFTVVFPGDDGWAQVQPGSGSARPLFCRLLMDHPEGGRRCRAFHAMAAVAACRRGLREQRCHAGVAVLVAPAAPAAVLGTCVFSPGLRARAWPAARARAEELGLDIETVRTAFDRLPELTAGQVEQAGRLLEVAADAVCEIARRARAEAELARLRGGADNPKERGCALVELARAMVEEWPEVDYSVDAIARAAGVTPNHFSALFRKHAGESFKAYLDVRRIRRAQVLLRETDLPIREVGRRVGFGAPSYFARRFRECVGQTPRAWRGVADAHASAVKAGAADASGVASSARIQARACRSRDAGGHGGV